MTPNVLIFSWQMESVKTDYTFKPGLLQEVTTVSLNCDNRIYCALWHASAFIV